MAQGDRGAEATTVVSARLPDAVVAWVDDRARETGRTRSGWLSFYLRRWIAEMSEKGVTSDVG
jgi:hypothetical protein